MRFGVLGPLEVTGPSGTITLGGRGQRILLSTLLCDPNHAVSSEQLIDAVWESAPPKTAAKNLQVHVHQLRKALGDSERIARYPHGYGLVVNDGELDAERFLSLAQAARRHMESGDVHSGRSCYVEALNFWRGPAFADLASVRCLREAIVRLTDARLQALENRVEADLSLGEHDMVAVELAALVREHPLREKLAGQLMTALFRCGRQADALQVFQDGYRLLRDELGVEPTEALQRIQLSILRGVDPSPVAVKTTPPKPFSAPTQLPARPQGFVGRRAALARLDDLADAATGLVTIVGLGGIGKTALAVDWAHRAGHRFPDGQLYLSLHGHAGSRPVDPGRALAVLLRSLDVRALDIPADLDAAAALYRSIVAGRKMLVVLDDAASAQQVRPLLPGSEHCLTLVTSRNRLNGLVAREGAARLDLDVLTPEESHAALAALAGPDRLAGHPGAVARLAAACGYLPLALRISAAHLADRPDLGVSDLVDELAKERLRKLTTDDDPLTSVAAVFSHSYTALADPEQRMFGLIAHSACIDVTAPAAAALAGVDENTAGATLDRLVSASMIERPRSSRYRLHDLMREFAQDLTDLPDADIDTATDRLMTWYLHTTHNAAHRLNPAVVRLALPGAQPAHRTDFGQWDEAYAWLEAERENLVAIIAWAAGTTRSNLSWRFADALRGFYNIRGLVNEYLWLAELALRTATMAGDRAGMAAARLGLAAATSNLGDLAAAQQHSEFAAQEARAAEWLHGGAAAHASAYHVSFWLAQPDEALRHLESSLAIASALGDVGKLANLHNEFTHIYIYLERHSEADYHYEQAVGLSAQLDIPLYEAHYIYNRGLYMRSLGRHDEAIDLVQRARTMLRLAGWQFESTCAGVIAEIYLDQNRLDEAELLLILADEHVADAFFRPVEHATARRWARLHRLRGQTEAARAALSGLLAAPHLSPLDRREVLDELAALDASIAS